MKKLGVVEYQAPMLNTPKSWNTAKPFKYYDEYFTLFILDKSEIPNFAKELREYLFAQHTHRNDSLTDEMILSQIQTEMSARQENQNTGFRWENNEQQLLKIKQIWHTQEADNQIVYDFLIGLFNSKEINLSFPYGLMGFILWLSRENQKTKDLTIEDFLDKTIRFLLSKKMKLNANWKQFAFFPEALDLDTWTSNNELSWRVGDLHIVKLLYRRANANPANNFFEIAENIGLYSTTRISEEQTQVSDSSLEQGSIGLVVLYKALYHETGQQKYLNTSLYWLKRTKMFLELELQNGYYAGRETNILDGLAGILIMLEELQKEELSPLLAYLAG